MKITLIDAGKRFNRDWIFRHLQYEFLPRQHYAITGPNGSGKSTLLQVIAGAIAISEGGVRYEGSPEIKPGGASTEIAPDGAYRYISLSAPYLDLIEEMTATEFLRVSCCVQTFSFWSYRLGDTRSRWSGGSSAQRDPVLFFRDETTAQARAGPLLGHARHPAG